MRAALFSRNLLVVVSCGLGLAVATRLMAQDVAEPADTSFTSLEPPKKAFERPTHLVVVRISADLLSQQLNRRIDVTMPVRETVLGTPVSGTARMVGEPRVELVPSSDQARFNVVFSGTVYSKTVGNGGPATVYGHSITSFTATKEVFFEPGKGFQSLPSKIEAKTQCYTDGIAASRGGLIGRIIERRAGEEVAAQQPQLTAIARERAKQRIEKAFDERLNSRIAQLNETVDFQVKLAELRTREGSRRLMACTTPQYLEIADMIYKGPEAAIELPRHALPAGSTAPIEVWVNKTLVPEKFADAVKSAFTSPDQSAVINGLALLPGMLGKEAAAAMTALAAEHKIGLENVGDWLVIEIDLTGKTGTTATAAASARGRDSREAARR